MKVENIDISSAIENARKQIKDDKSLSPGIKTTVELLILIVTILVEKITLNSSNSSIPPSQDPNRSKKKRKTRKDKGVKRNPGAQKGHKGNTLKQVDTPTEIEFIEIDRRTIPAGKYKDVGIEKRQVFDFEMKLKIKEYQAQVLEDENGNQFVATFPDGVTKAAQYGNISKSQAVYMSVFQLIPLARILDYFKEQVGLSLSKGSISNFKKLAFKRLQEIEFKAWVSNQLIDVDSQAKVTTSFSPKVTTSKFLYPKLI